ncbi:hypothetical protein JX265_005775 [Neoarthrinium moseri]|uniref:G-protein coupled receptors family 1 profile domain-containing protein n=1 Tax=Neoarthrinium moseri TaxID=1658444 RepID=A0A9P9WNB3_9PEZI|nr:uncharacterized protein JN550_012303 [Neoarthrinium moseri]KAI1841282.1 hypothetical protein JX266_012518 [Neoarthrinium moseri]KAI1858945.1 hypothetical protein JN550_012303 [Neoarthrinium moseri]KAI1871789.1 hypothetical protein JX265_005775 [Neoarthrinium moseri]
MATNSDGVPQAYFEPPNSLLDMSSQTYNGLLAIGTLATTSVLFTSALLAFITWRMIAWKSHYTSAVGRNQSVVLIYQLVLADFLQSLGFLVSFHWASNHRIIGPNGACFAQGLLIQVGDVASALFVLAIAVHTTYQVVLSRSVTYRMFIGCILGLWSFALLLTCLAPVVGGRYIFLRAGVWCWISSDHDNMRLLLHYLWIFIVQFGSIVTYVTGFWYLYRSKQPGAIRINGASDKAIRKASTAMLAYALVYTILTLPLAAGRMAAMSQDTLPDEYYLFAGALFTSCGWVDTILYAITRRSLLFKELDAYNGQSTPEYAHSSRRMPRQGSTESILAQTGFGQPSGIMMDRTVKIELDDLESQASHEHEGKGYYVSAKATKK